MAPLDATGRRQQETPVSRGFLDFLGLAWIGIWQPRMDSNHRMPESESGALPLGDGAMELIVLRPNTSG